MEIDLAPDGAGGYDALVRGGIPIRRCADDRVRRRRADDGRQSDGAPSMFARALDTNHDGTISADELANSSLLAAFLVADLHELSALSVGFSVHLAPCDSGRCTTATPEDTCHDRVIDGSETDVDCGGSCAPCASGASCSAPTDCQSNGCDAGHCRAATCSDGARDGFESDVDCGAGCPTCDVGRGCATNADCTSMRCSGSGVDDRHVLAVFR